MCYHFHVTVVQHHQLWATTSFTPLASWFLFLLWLLLFGPNCQTAMSFTCSCVPSRCRCQIAFNMCSEVECQVACCSHPHLELQHDQPLFSVRMFDAVFVMLFRGLFCCSTLTCFDLHFQLPYWSTTALIFYVEVNRHHNQPPSSCHNRHRVALFDGQCFFKAVMQLNVNLFLLSIFDVIQCGGGWCMDVWGCGWCFGCCSNASSNA